MQITLQDLAQSLLIAGEFAVPRRLPHIHPDDWRLMGNQAWGAILAAGPAAAALLKKGTAIALATFFSMFLVVVAPFLKRLDNRGKHPSTANVHYRLININAQGLSSICLVSGVLGLGYCLFVVVENLTESGPRAMSQPPSAPMPYFASIVSLHALRPPRTGTKYFAIEVVTASPSAVDPRQLRNASTR